MITIRYFEGDFEPWGHGNVTRGQRQVGSLLAVTLKELILILFLAQEKVLCGEER
jgi:hypothetical protein